MLFPRLGAKVWLCLKETFGTICLILFEKSLFRVVTAMTAQNKTNLRPVILRDSLRSSHELRGRRVWIRTLGCKGHEMMGPLARTLALGIKAESRKIM